MTPGKKSPVLEKTQNDYELILIISPEVEGEAHNTVIDNISRFITEKGGTISQVEPWGRRKLAYPIKHFREGGYVLMRVKMEPSQNKALEANLKISEDVIRYLLIRLDS